MSESAAVRATMRPFGELTPWRLAYEQGIGLGDPVQESEDVGLQAAVGRALARDVVSPVDVPDADRAAMDGYAVHAADVTEAGSRLRCRQRVLAGQPATTGLERGDCVEVATGAPIPAGADAVVPVEHTERDAGTVLVLEPVRHGEHVASRGEDVRQGTVLARERGIVTPATVGVLASVGISELEVFVSPRILLLPTGDELAPIGGPLPPGHVYDSNSVAVAALLAEAGAVVERGAIVHDDRRAVREQLRRPGYDLVVTLGGTSVGRHDLVTDVMAEVGDVLVHGVAVKPGKPLLLGRVEGRPTIGLPGFPTSCLMLAYALLEPVVRRMARLPDARRARRTARLTEAVQSPAGKHQFLTVRLDNGAARPAYKASSTITSMSEADGWIEIDAAVDRLSAGAEVEVVLF